MSAIVVSSLLLYVCWSSLTSFSLVTVRFQSEVGGKRVGQPDKSKQTELGVGRQQAVAHLV